MDKPKNFDIYFFVLLHCYYRSLTFGGKTGYLAMYPSKLLFFVASNKSEVVWKLVWQLVYQVCYTWYYALFYLWWVGFILKYCKVPKYHDQDWLEILAYCPHFQRWFKFLKRMLIWLKWVISTKKLPVRKAESSLKSNLS